MSQLQDANLRRCGDGQILRENVETPFSKCIALVARNTLSIRGDYGGRIVLASQGKQRVASCRISIELERSSMLGEKIAGGDSSRIMLELYQ